MSSPLRLAKDLALAQAPFFASSWSAASALPGKLVELSGNSAHARLSSAVSAVWTAQLEGETTAWIQPEGSSFFPPDFRDCGVDLDTLSVIHIPKSAGAHAAFRAAELLLRSGAFGLLVLDLREVSSRIDPAWQGRLLTLAREHASRILFLTTKSRSADSLGPLIALRLEPRRTRLGPGKFSIENRVLKNKAGVLAVSRVSWKLSGVAPEAVIDCTDAVAESKGALRCWPPFPQELFASFQTHS